MSRDILHVHRVFFFLAPTLVSRYGIGVYSV